MHPSIPSFSMIVMKMSIVDFGRSSNLTAGARACCIWTATDLSSASWEDCQTEQGEPTECATYAYRHSSSCARERRKLDLHVQATFLVVRCAFGLSWTVPGHSSERVHQRRSRQHNSLTLHKLSSSSRSRCMQNRWPD